MVTGLGLGASVGFGVKVYCNPLAGPPVVVFVLILVVLVAEVALLAQEVIAMQSVVAEPPMPTVGLLAP